MALYKGKRGGGDSSPERQKSALFRSRPPAPPPPPPPSEEPTGPDFDPSDPGELSAEGDQFPDLPMPSDPVAPSVPSPPSTGGTGKVFGGTRGTAYTPPPLPTYKETIVIGGDPKKEEPPPPLDHGSPQGDLDQTMAAPGMPQAPSPPPPPAIDKEIIEKAQAEAQQMIQQAQMQAQETLEEASAQAAQAAEEARQQAAQQGYQEGLQAGLEEGRKQGQSEMAQMIDAVKTEFVELVQMRRKVMADMEPELVTLAVDVAKRVVGDELKTNREVIVGIVRSSIATLQERDEILIRVNPSEYEIVKSHQAEFEAMVEGLRKFVVQPDGAIAAGSCAIETNLGNVDARIETQFEAIRQGLDEVCKIRQFERKDAILVQPVEVPGDPDFHSRLKRGEVGAQTDGGEGGEQALPEAAEAPGEAPEASAEELPPEMELLPEPTEELFATLSPEEQQQYMEAYQQQQAYLEELQAKMQAQTETQPEE